MSDNDTMKSTPEAEPALVTILTPVFEDWESLAILLTKIDETLSDTSTKAHIVVVDDGSNTGQSANQTPCRQFQNIRSVRIIRLRANLGHQRAIAVGLSWLNDQKVDTPVVVMDSDGEDSPSDIPKLLTVYAEHRGTRAVFAARSKRSESLAFVFFYHLYKLIHLILTGKPVKVGNFSVIPPQALGRAVVMSELWNHYAATLFKSRFPVALFYTPRGKRIAGRSSMNIYSLATHGLSGLSVFGELVGVRLLMLSSFALIALSPLLAVSLTTPSRAVQTALLVLTLVDVIVLLSSMFFVFMLLASRDAARILPARDYQYFIRAVETSA